MRLADPALALLLRPRIVHRLTGRLRVHLPILKHVPAEHAALAEIIRRVLETPDGIVGVSVSIHTGNVLIEYDASKATEAEVIGFLQSVTRLATANRERLLRIDPADASRIEENVLNWLRGKLHYRLTMDGADRIPDDVLD